MKNKILKYFIISLLLICGYYANAQKQGNKPEQELIAEAGSLFKSGDYVKALPLYSQLLSLHPKNPFYSYRFGVCLLFGDRRDTEKPLRYLTYAAERLKNEEKVFYHLGLAYHLNYRFPEAIKEYEKYVKAAKGDKSAALEANYSIMMCRNGMSLLSKINDFYVIEKTEVRIKDFYRSYDLSEFGGRFLAKPEFLKTKRDKKNKDNSIVFFSDTNSVIYFSGYGNKGETKRDIYRSWKMPNGKWGTPERLSNVINTPYDEDYPYVLPDGKTLYFSSKGHNTMGGYDIFKSVWDTITEDWTTPENLDFAINTPFDDILFVTDPEQITAYFSSVRNSVEDYIMVYKVRIDRRPETPEKELQILANLYDNDSTYLQSLSLLHEKAKLEVNITPQQLTLLNEDNKSINISAKTSELTNIPKNISNKSIVDTAFLQYQISNAYINNIKKQTSTSYSLTEKKRAELSDLSIQIKNAEERAAKKSGQEKNDEQELIQHLQSKASDVKNDINNLGLITSTLETIAIKKEQAAKQQLETADEIQKLVATNKIDSSKILLSSLLEKSKHIDSTANTETLIKEYFNLEIAEKAKLASEYKKMAEDIKQETDDLRKEAEALKKEAATTRNQDIKTEYLNQASAIEATANKNKENIDHNYKLAEKAEKEAENLGVLVQSLSSTAYLIDNEVVSETLISDNKSNKKTETEQFAVQNITTGETNQSNKQETNAVTTLTSNAQEAKTEQNIVAGETNQSNKQETNAITNLISNAQEAKITIKENTIKDLRILSQTLNTQAFELYSKTEESYILAHKRNTTAELLKLKADSISNIIKQKGTDKSSIADSTLLAITEMNYIKAIREATILNELAVTSKQTSEKLRKEENSIQKAISTLKNDINVIDTSKITAYKDSLYKETDILIQQSHVPAVIELKNKNIAQKIEQQIKFSNHKADSLEQIIAINRTEAQTKREKAGNTSGAKKRRQFMQEAESAETKAAAAVAVLQSIHDSVRYLQTQLSALQMEVMYASAMWQTIEDSAITLKPGEKKPVPEEVSVKTKSLAGNELFSNSYSPFTSSETLPTFNYNQLELANEIETQQETQIQESIKEEQPNIKNEFQAVMPSSRILSSSEEIIILGKAEKIEQVNTKLKMQINVLKSKLKNIENADSKDSLTKAINLLTKKYDSLERVKEELNNLTLNIKQQNFSSGKQDNIEKAESAIISQVRNERMQADIIMTGLADKNDKNRTISRNTADSIYKQAREALTLLSEYKNLENQAEYDNEKLLTEALLQNQATINYPAEAKIFSEEASILFKQADILRDSIKMARVSLFYSDSLLQRANKLEKLAIVKQKIAVNIIRKQLDNYAKDEVLLANIKEKDQNNNELTSTETVTFSPSPLITQNNVSTTQPEITQTTSIELNSEIPAGIIYKVQIAALREMTDYKYFQGLSPISAEKAAGSEFFLYMLGQFLTYEEAAAQRDEVKAAYYPDAFVVAYLNGMRIKVNEAREIEGKNIIADNLPIKQQTTISSNQTTDIIGQVAGVSSISTLKGLFYTVQVGVFGSPRTSDRLFNLNPLFHEKLANGNYRYLAGVFPNRQEASASRAIIARRDVPDAFVVAYYNGLKISLQEAALLESEGVVSTSSIPITQTNAITSEVSTTTISNNNQINIGAESVKIEYRVQIGAFRREVSNENLENFKRITGTENITTYISASNLLCYTAGSYSNLAEAQANRRAISTSGIPDAFIVAFNNGKIIPLWQARQITNN